MHAVKGPHLSDGEISETYRVATVERIYEEPQYSWRLYRGATPEEPVNGMFSFFPCQIASGDPRGFARPIIHLPEVINPRHKQSYKLLREDGVKPDHFAGLWQRVVDQVVEADCELGVHASLPPTTVREEGTGLESSTETASRSC
jgi:hypothetical protein